LEDEERGAQGEHGKKSHIEKTREAIIGKFDSRKRGVDLDACLHEALGYSSTKARTATPDVGGRVRKINRGSFKFRVIGGGRASREKREKKGTTIGSGKKKATPTSTLEI